MPYDSTNIFARMIRGEIPVKKVYEDVHVLAINDIKPKAPVHILVMPKGPYTSHDDFSSKASETEIVALTRAIGLVARTAGLDKTGYRLLANHGRDSHQEVGHYHIHILGGRPLGPLLVDEERE